LNWFTVKKPHMWSVEVVRKGLGTWVIILRPSPSCSWRGSSNIVMEYDHHTHFVFCYLARKNLYVIWREWEGEFWRKKIMKDKMDGMEFFGRGWVIPDDIGFREYIFPHGFTHFDQYFGLCSDDFNCKLITSLSRSNFIIEERPIKKI
jgi:hypothetical protein